MGKKSKVWTYFQVNQEDSNKAKCLVCVATIGCKGGTTSGLINHCKTHSTEYQEYSTTATNSSKKTIKNTSSTQPTINNFMPKSNVATQKLLDESITKFLAESGVAFRVVDLDSFKNLIKIANDKLTVKSREFYSKLVTRKADEIRQDMINIIEFCKSELKTVSFTTDIWISNTGDPFISLTMHFITADWELIRFTPFVRPFPERHTGKNISVCLDKMIEQLGLDSPDFHLFSVNYSAANMLLGIKLSEHLIEYTCDIHKLELVIKDALKKTEGMVRIITNTKKLAQFVNKSPVALQELKDSCDKCQLKFKKPVNPPNTRWSGFLMNLKSILYL